MDDHGPNILRTCHRPFHCFRYPELLIEGYETSMAVDSVIAFLFGCQTLQKKIQTQKGLFYRYNQRFRFKAVLSKNENGIRNTYLASKIYIIDDEIANLESLNFTGGGTTSNYETRIRVNHAPSVQKIVEEFDYLMNGTDRPEVDLHKLGSLLYRELIN